MWLMVISSSDMSWLLQPKIGHCTFALTETRDISREPLSKFQILVQREASRSKARDISSRIGEG